MTNDLHPIEPPSEREMGPLREAHDLFTKQMLTLEGVHGVGIGYKITDGQNTRKLALIVRVHNKVPRDKLPPRELVPPEYRFFSQDYNEEVVVLTDVQERPKPVEYPHISDGDLTNRVRPISGG